jgi:hypothetical protein
MVGSVDIQQLLSNLTTAKYEKIAEEHLLHPDSIIPEKVKAEYMIIMEQTISPEALEDAIALCHETNQSDLAKILIQWSGFLAKWRYTFAVDLEAGDKALETLQHETKTFLGKLTE